MPATTSVKIFALFLMWGLKDCFAINNVRLILPPIVQAGSSATLLCLYDLEGSSLYSVQWYRGKFEFFRFVPSETPPSKMFQIPGLFVDVATSNEHQVTLKDVPVHLAGVFSCEITIDVPRFSTSCVSGHLTVVSLNLELFLPKSRIRHGDVVTAKCTLSPALSSTKLKFHWNVKPISDEFIRRDMNNSITMELNTSLIDMENVNTRTVHLRCSALLNNTYFVVSRSISFQMERFRYGDDSGVSSNIQCGNSKFVQYCCTVLLMINTWKSVLINL